MTEATPIAKPSRVRRVMTFVGRILAGLVVLLLLVAAFVYVKSERAMNQTMSVRAEELTIPTDPESIARGRTLATTNGCLECHASDGGGQLFLCRM